MPTGYEEIDNLMNEQYENLDKQQTLQNEIIDKGIQKQQAQIDKQKADYEKEAEKTAKGLYTDYRKQANPYGATAEALASQGLNKSGYAESTQTSMYNTYQRNVTELVNKTRQLKADADFQMNQAYLDADIQKAQNTLSIYKQQSELAITEYNLRYQKHRDDIADQQFERQMQMQERQNAQAQSNWEREYQLSLQQLEASRRSS